MAAPQSHTSPAPPRAAEPRLASSLLAAPALESVFDSLALDDTPLPPAPVPAPETLSTHIPSLDAALRSTFQRARVVALSAESGSARALVARALLVDCLLRGGGGGVAVVDATGNFDVVALYAGILARVERECGSEGAQDVAARALDRVKIMRVFDFVGMREAVGELRDGLEGGVAGGAAGGVWEGDVDTMSEDVATVEVATERVSPPRLKRTEIADSEDEDDGLEDEDDDMLFDATAAPANPSPAPAGPSPAPQPAADHAPSSPAPTTQQPTPPLELILIDNLSHVLTPLLKQDTASANTLGTTFLTTLKDLTRTHALHTILLNPCTTPRPTSPTRTALDNAAAPAPHQAFCPRPPPAPSIFSSNAAVPALLGLLSRYADAHVLVSMLPRRKMDARVFYADSGARERGKRRGVEMVGVAEVIADRSGGRVGAWGAFKEGKDGGIEGL